MKSAISFSPMHELRIGNIARRLFGVVMFALIFSNAVIAEEFEATLL